MRITEARLKRLIKEEVEIYLLTEEMKGELLNEGIMKYLDKVFGRRERWEDLVDDIEQDGEVEKKKFLDLPSRQRVVALALAAFLSTGAVTGGATYVQDLHPGTVSQSQSFVDALIDASARTQDISNFRQIAQAEAEGPGVTDQNSVNRALDQIRSDYTFEDAPLAAGRGLFIDGDPNKPAQGFAYVPAEQISDDTVLPFVNMTKGDYETFLRMNWLAGAQGGDERLEDFVTGGGKSGTSVFWSYEDSLYSPIVDNDSETGVEMKMRDMYGSQGEQILMLPLEWSIAHDLMQKRAGR